MRFIDSLNIRIKAGRGGKGIISFRREAYVNRGGPDGGDGGDGGDILFKGSNNLNTLFHLFITGEIVAEDGKDGYRKNQTGASGKDKVVEVPLGTIVLDQDGRVICDVVSVGPYLVAKGGKGGRGNARFKSSRNPAPRLCENGKAGEEFIAKIELRFLSDIGFLGKPSAGKSSLLNLISNAKSKVGEYDFTTLLPQLGVVRLDRKDGFVVADLPGIIEGASSGRGLGIRFLQHVKRAKILVFVVDCGQVDDPIEDIKEVSREIAIYQDRADWEPQFIIAHKADLPNFKVNFLRLKETYKQAKIIKTSLLDSASVFKLKRVLYNWLKESQPSEEERDYPLEITFSYEEDIVVKRILADLFEITGKRVKQIYDLIPLTSAENLQRFNFLLSKIGVWKLLESEGILPGARVRIYSYEFVWSDEKF